MSQPQRASPPPSIGIDLGGTATRFVAVSDGHVLAEHIATTPHTGTPSSIQAFLIEQVTKLQGAAIAGIGIGASGPIDQRGIINNPATLPAFTGLDLPSALTEAFGVTCHIENDAVTAALGELQDSGNLRTKDLLVVTLGTGVGVAMLRDGQPIRGLDGEHPEAGHLSVPGPPAPCYCGRSACWEQTASRSGLQRRSVQLLGTGELERIAAAAHDHDPRALQLLEEYGTRIGEGLVELLTQHRPSIVVLAGSGAELFDSYIDAVHRACQTIAGCFTPPAITQSRLGPYGGAIGAAALLELAI